MKNFGDNRFLEEVYGDNLEIPIDNRIRYPGWINYAYQINDYEKFLGSTFQPITKIDYRLKRYQNQVFLPLYIKKYQEYQQKAQILDNYIPENHFKEVCQLASYIKTPIKSKELIPTLLALYELKLFVESKILLDDKIFKEIISEYYHDREKKHKYTLKEIRSATIYFFHNLAKFVRDLYTEKGGIFDNSSPIVQRFSEAVRSFISTYVYDTIDLAKFNLNKFESLSSDHQEAYKAFIIPKIFLKVILAMHVKQEFQEIAFKMRKQQYNSILLPEDLEALGSQFFNQYLSSNKNIKSSYGICLTIIKELDKDLAESIITETKTVNFLQTYHNIKIRHGKFIEVIISNLKSEESIISS
ncbi:MAG: hypothetical protein ACXACX_02165 [Candidatus Hodarchaeales archaeon]